MSNCISRMCLFMAAGLEALAEKFDPKHIQTVRYCHFAFPADTHNDDWINNDTLRSYRRRRCEKLMAEELGPAKLAKLFCNTSPEMTRYYYHREDE